MRLILIHIGDGIPEHFWVCLKQARKYFCGEICTVIPRVCLDDERLEVFGVRRVSWESLAESNIYKEFEQVSSFLKGFWNVTMGRLFLLEILMRKYGMKDVVHIENDNLIYADPYSMIEAFRKQANDSVAMTPIGDDYIAAAYCFIPHIEAISKLNTIMKSLLIHGEEHLLRRTSKQPVNEMTLLSYIKKSYGNVLKYLPIQPAGKGATGITPFKSVFDPASYGQHLDGIPSNPGIPLYDEDRHWLAPSLKSGKYYKINFVEHKGNQVPFLTCGAKTYRINSLHIHSKRLERFV